MDDESQHAPPRRSRYVVKMRHILHETKHDLWIIHKHNLTTIRTQPLREISGSLGDLGTLLPLLLALTAHTSISLPSTLLFSGLANILTGIIFGLPLPVQPMKAIAAISIARSLTLPQTISAGLFVAGAIGFLSLTGLIRWVTAVVPIPVVKGIQVGTGLSLVISAGGLFGKEGDWVVLVLAFLALLMSGRLMRVPYALVVFVIGVVMAVASDGLDQQWRNARGLGFSIAHPRLFIPSPADFGIGVSEAGIGQLPLTTLNSVIAVTFLAEDLLPEIKTPSTTAIGLSVAIINLVGCWFGAMPVCHGSGGLAAQYRFGARSGASVIFLGLVKLLLGLFASKIALYIFNGFPNTLLCILLIAAGLELVKVGESLNTAGARDVAMMHQESAVDENLGEEGSEMKVFDLSQEERKRRWAVMFMTVGGILAFKNDAVGFLAGMLCHWSFQLQDYWEIRRTNREGRIRLETDDRQC